MTSASTGRRPDDVRLQKVGRIAKGPKQPPTLAAGSTHVALSTKHVILGSECKNFVRGTGLASLRAFLSGSAEYKELGIQRLSIRHRLRSDQTVSDRPAADICGRPIR